MYLYGVWYNKTVEIKLFESIILVLAESERYRFNLLRSNPRKTT